MRAVGAEKVVQAHLKPRRGYHILLFPKPNMCIVAQALGVGQERNIRVIYYCKEQRADGSKELLLWKLLI